MGGFRAFLTTSNALALAIGVIIGTALGGVVNSLVNDVIMPPIGLLLGKVDFSSLRLVLQADPDPAKEVAIRYGVFVNAVIAFIVIGFVVYWISRTLVPEVPPAATKTCAFCREANAADATRCKFCTSEI